MADETPRARARRRLARAAPPGRPRDRAARAARPPAAGRRARAPATPSSRASRAASCRSPSGSRSCAASRTRSGSSTTSSTSTPSSSSEPTRSPRRASREAGLVHHKGLVKVLGRGELHRRRRGRGARLLAVGAVAAIEAAGGCVTVVASPYGDRRPPVRGQRARQPLGSDDVRRVRGDGASAVPGEAASVCVMLDESCRNIVQGRPGPPQQGPLHPADDRHLPARREHPGPGRRASRRSRRIYQASRDGRASSASSTCSPVARSPVPPSSASGSCPTSPRRSSSSCSVR